MRQKETGPQHRGSVWSYQRTMLPLLDGPAHKVPNNAEDGSNHSAASVRLRFSTGVLNLCLRPGIISLSSMGI